MDRVTTELGQLDEGALRHLAERLAPRLRAGDFLALKGDLGAGKTAFARFLIRALMETAHTDRILELLCGSRRWLGRIVHGEGL